MVDGQQLRELIRLSLQAQSWQVERDGQALTLSVAPEVKQENGVLVARIGAYIGSPPEFATVRYGPLDGFWQGAVGVAAMWAGLTDTLIASLERARPRTDQVGLIRQGEIEANCWAIDAALEQAALSIDAAPSFECERLALSCRQTVRVHSELIIRTLLHESGPAGLAFHPRAGTQLLELTMALGQSHGDRDLAALGERVRNDGQSSQSIIGGGGGKGTGSVG